MNINKDMYNEISSEYSDYVQNGESVFKHEYEKKYEHCDSVESDESIFKDEFNKEKYECDEKKDKYDKKKYECHEKKDECDKKDDGCDSEESKILINSKLKVGFDTNNKMIYLCPGKIQYFVVDVIKACGDVTIKYVGDYSKKGICGNLGVYRIVEGGIVVQTYCKLDSKKIDILKFVAIDEVTKECSNFVIIFSGNQSSCYCKKGHKK